MITFKANNSLTCQHEAGDSWKYLLQKRLLNNNWISLCCKNKVLKVWKRGFSISLHKRWNYLVKGDKVFAYISEALFMTTSPMCQTVRKVEETEKIAKLLLLTLWSEVFHAWLIFVFIGREKQKYDFWLTHFLTWWCEMESSSS